MTRRQHRGRAPENPAPARRRRSPVGLANPPPGTRIEAVARLIEQSGEPPWRLTAILHGVRERGRTRFEHMHQLPAGLRRRLADELGPSLFGLEPVAASGGEAVDKVLFETTGSVRFETVRARYRDGWASLCVSSQAGCGLGCTFCATGAMGLERNLTADEILGQVFDGRWRGPGAPPVRSIAFMGMGEALANPHLFAGLGMLADPAIGGLSPRRITVSTVGFAPNLARLVAEHPEVTITLSVHSPFPDQRAELVPLERRFSLGENLAVVDRHVAASGRRVFLAYALIDGVNDTRGHVEALARLVAERPRPDLVPVSVIPYNRAFGADPRFRSPTEERTRAFVRGLRDRGVRAMRRRQGGADVDAACGQLHARDSRARLASPGRRR
ncbi:radical SAM protein [Glycomyces salinus]|uniref:radical SAM protein n=1 Tax=Glycomyces salinus TaxID=980294 RepID=UPI0018EAEF5D|nr:radical SAM protein [Glycomyces salinus]